MSDRILERLRGDEFLMRFAVIANPRALHWALERSDEIHQIREGLAVGELTEDAIRRFVAHLLTELKAEQLFPYDVSLAAIAVAVERRATAFADEFLSDLARLQRVELPMAIRVAREALSAHSETAGNKSGAFNFAATDQMPATWETAPRFVEPDTGQIEQYFEYGAA